MKSNGKTMRMGFHVQEPSHHIAIEIPLRRLPASVLSDGRMLDYSKFLKQANYVRYELSVFGISVLL